MSTSLSSPIYDVSLVDIDGRATTLAPFKGRVLLIVNVASRCGFTPQYAGLEAVYQRYKSEGFTVLGFPCNQFLRQEPGTDSEIKSFCSLTYSVTFPMFTKLDVNGSNRHPLFEILAGKESPFPGRILWNFTKFLISRDGQILNRFGPMTKPENCKVVSAIKSALTAATAPGRT